MALLIESGLPENKKDNVVIHNGRVNINQIDNDICRILIEALHAKVFWGKKIFCNGIKPLTP